MKPNSDRKVGKKVKKFAEKFLNWRFAAIDLIVILALAPHVFR